MKVKVIAIRSNDGKSACYVAASALDYVLEEARVLLNSERGWGKAHADP